MSLLIRLVADSKGQLQKFYKGLIVYFIMSALFMSPNWFFGYGIAFGFFFAVISLIIAIYAFNVHKTTGQKLAEYFGYGFLLLFMANLIQASTDTLLYFATNTLTVQTLGILGVYLYMVFMVSGLVTLMFVSLKSDKIRTLWILLAISLLAIWMSRNQIYTFYTISSIFLAFITWHFIENYLHNKQWLTLSVALAFVFLWFSSFHYIISVNHTLFYVIGTILELFAYIMILVNWYLVRK